MISFEVLEKVFGLVGEVTHRVEQLGGKEHVTVGIDLTDEAIDQILVGHAQSVDMIHHSQASTTFVLV